jgi:predicted transcriptional regulator
MARINWIDDDNAPQLDEHLHQLEHFSQSIADGVIDAEELAKQESNLVEAMKAVEGELDDATHAKVTALLVELTAYNVMQVLHGMAVERVRQVVE